jgi:hypothetical protein
MKLSGDAFRKRLISGQYSVANDEQPEVGSTTSAPMQNSPVEQAPGQDPQKMPTPAATPASPPTPPVPTQAAPPAPMVPEGAAFRSDVRPSAAERMIAPGSPTVPQRIPLPMPGCVRPVQRTPIPQPGAPAAPPVERNSPPGLLTTPTRDLSSTSAEPIRRISHDTGENQSPQSSQGWRPRRK